MAGKRLRLSKREETQLAKDLFNLTWTYLRKRRRTPAEVEAMVRAANASAHFWGHVGKPSNFAISEWQLSRVYVVAGRPQDALRHAKRALAICRRHRLADWQIAYAYEALCRASAIAGDDAATRRYRKLAGAAGDRIEEADDREHFARDLATLPRRARRRRTT